MVRQKEFRAQLNDEEWEFLNTIREQNPAIKTAHDIFVLFVNEHNTCHQLKNELQTLRNINLNTQATNEILGELMLKGVGFRDANNLPVTEVKIGSQYLGIKSAKKKIKEEIESRQINKYWHKESVHE